MPLPTPTPTGLGTLFGALGGIVGPLMMVLLALQKPGPVRTLSKAEADAPERARKPATLGLAEPPLAPLARAGIVVREADGRIWLDRAALRRRQRRIALGVGIPALIVGAGVVVLLFRR